MKQWLEAGWLREIRGELAFLPKKFTLLSLAVMTGIVLAAAGLVEEAWMQVNRVQTETAWDLALAVSDSFNRSLQSANHKLDAFLTDISLDDAGPREEARLKQDLRENSDLFAALMVIDDKEQVQFSTSALLKPGSVAGEFKPAIDQHSLTFGPPLIAGGEHWLPLIRPIGRVSGQTFSVVAMLRLPYIARDIATLPRDGQTVVAVFEPDGGTLLRVPVRPQAGLTRVPANLTKLIGTDASSTFIGRSPVDHRDHLTVVMRDGAFPIGVVVSVPIAVFFQQWLPQATTIILLATILLLLMIILHLALASELYRRHQAEVRVATTAAEARRIGARYRLLADYSSDVIVQHGFDGMCRFASPSMEQMFGWRPEELVGRDTRHLIHPFDWPMLDEEVQFLVKGCGPIRSQFRHLHRDGHYVWVESSMQMVDKDGSEASFVANMRDITERIEAEKRLSEAASAMAQLAATDQLTGVANRRRFNEELGREWRRATREDGPLSLLLLDVDHFKIYNDTYGHQGGDDVLKTVAAAIQGALRRPNDLVARWGGEEFVVLLPGTDLRGAVEVAEIIRAAIEDLHIPHRAVAAGFLTVSIGVATGYPSRNQAPEPMLAEADANLYEAKRQGRNRVGVRPGDGGILVGYEGDGGVSRK